MPGGPFDPTNVAANAFPFYGPSPLMPGSADDLRRQMAFDAIGNAGISLINASGPSPYPTNWGTAFGALGGGAFQGVQGAEDKYLKRALTGTQVAMANQKIKQLQEWQKLFGGTQPDPTNPGAPTVSADAAAPPSPSAPNPNNIGNVREGSGFAQPADFNSGVNLAVGNVRSYPKEFNNGQPMTLVQIGERWAPRGDGKNDPVQWAKNVSTFSGLPPDQPLDLADPQVAAAFARGVHGAEWGPSAVKPVNAYASALTSSPSQGAPPMPAPPAAAPQVAQAPTPAGPPPGAPAVPPQAAPPQQPAAPPVAAVGPPPVAPGGRTLGQVVQSIPPGVRQMIGVMGPEQGLPLLMKYADPESTPAIDVRTGAVVFAPKTELGTGRYAPVDAARLGLEMKREAREGINAKVIPGPGGAAVPNAPLLEFDKGVSAAQGTDPAGHALKIQMDTANKEHGELQNNALQARTGIAQMTRLTSLLDQVNTGKFTSTTQEIKATAKAAGIDLNALGIRDDVAPGQAADALVKQLALSLRNPSQGAGMPGALSNQDRDFLAKMVPSLETTPEGRKLMADYALKMYQRSIDVAKIANQYVRSDKFKTDPSGMYAAIQDYAEKNPLFSPDDLPKNGYSPMPGSSSIPAPPSGFKVLGR